MSNHLAHENSPYLLQHANNPVDWYPWGREALEKARSENKPIFLSIGYAACHWCHVMAHESFEDPETASLMNRFFVNIKVDREERPDLDSIYMAAVVGMTGSGGWPMSVFLTPQAEPFFAGTYFPPVQRYNLPSFRNLLQSVGQAWQEERANILDSSKNIAQQLSASAQLASAAGTLSKSSLEQAVQVLAQSYNWEKGGWGGAPKFPQPMAIEFMLRQASRGDQSALKIAVHALRQMAKGGMYDIVGGGFARYSTDEDWLVPHFEKMLYDNALLSQAYLHAYLLTGEVYFREVCCETLDFVTRELTHPLGGFYSSLDADSEGEEGKFYLWTEEEIRQALLDFDQAAIFLAAYGVSTHGNFEGRTVLQRLLDDEALGEQFNLTRLEAARQLSEARLQLLEARSKRVHPGTDDKVLVAWNALMLISYTEAGRYLHRPDYIETGRRNAAFLLEHLHPQDRLLRSWRMGEAGTAGRARHNASLEDVAALILGLLALYQSDPDPRWYTAANDLAGEMVAHYADPKQGFFDTRDDHETLLYRPKDLQDNATPSGNALAAHALLQMAAYGDHPEWRDLADSMLARLIQNSTRYPTAFAHWLCAADFAIGPAFEIAILGNPESQETRTMLDILWQNYRPRLVAAVSQFPPAPGSPLILSGRPLMNGHTTAYVCQNSICKLPVNSPEALREQVDRLSFSPPATTAPTGG